jgi:hydrogenase nickel incorporation protein HypA/HybF
MHEMGIATQIVEISISSIPDHYKDVRVESVNLKIGKLTAIVPDSLRFCFEIAAKDTPLSGAVLNIEEIPIVARCLACNLEWTINEPVFVCSKCQSGKIETISGRELDIVSIEIEEKDSSNSHTENDSSETR